MQLGPTQVGKKTKALKLTGTTSIDSLDGQAQNSKAKEFYYTWNSYADLQTSINPDWSSDFFGGMDTITFNPRKKNILDLPGNWGATKKGKYVPDIITGTPVVQINADTGQGFDEFFKILEDFWFSDPKPTPETFMTAIASDSAYGGQFMYLAGTDSNGGFWGLTIMGSPLNPFYVI